MAPPSSPLASVLLLLLQQVFSRVLTFALNIWIARRVSAAVLGVVSVNLALLDALLLLLCREPLRRAALRFADAKLHVDDASHAAAVNLFWMLEMPFAAVITAAFIGFALLQRGAYADIQGYSWCVLVYAGALLLEMLAEPMFVVATMRADMRARVLIESIAVVARVATAFVLVVGFGVALPAFAWAQAVFSGVTLLGFSVYAATRRRCSVVPRRRLVDRGSALVFAKMRRVAALMTLQSAQKFVLSEGEKVVMVAVYSNATQNGVYALVQNLGSLVARFVFQPIEEMCAMEFSRLLNRADDERVAAARVDHALSLLAAMQKLALLIGVLAAAFGPPYAFVVIRVMYGAVWAASDAPSLLAVYCFYVMLMAINGVSEAFVFSVITPAQLRRYNAIVLVFSAVHVLCCIALLSLGALGLIVANALSMAARIAYSGVFIRTYFGEAAFARLMQLTRPNAALLAALALAAAVTTASARRSLPAAAASAPLSALLPHVGVGCVCLALVTAVGFVAEQPFLALLRDMLSQRRKRHHRE